jgi:hypothetical protein
VIAKAAALREMLQTAPESSSIKQRSMVCYSYNASSGDERDLISIYYQMQALSERDF